MPRELRWKSLEVHARLDDAGALHVDERHTTELSGNWNGGERVFQLSDGQTIEVRGMSRIDPSTGTRTELVRGDLSQVDHYDVSQEGDGVTLRWRVRAPDAPLLQHAQFVHLVSYVHHGVAQAEDADVFSIAHDFSFERPGPLDTISVTLDVDRASWQPIGTLPAVSRGQNLAHDASFVVRAKLAWIGSGHPPSPAHVELTPRSVPTESWALCARGAGTRAAGPLELGAGHAPTPLAHARESLSPAAAGAEASMRLWFARSLWLRSVRACRRRAAR